MDSFDPAILQRVLSDYEGWLLHLMGQDPTTLPCGRLDYSIKLLISAAKACKLAPPSLGLCSPALSPAILYSVLPDAPPSGLSEDHFVFTSYGQLPETVFPEDYSSALTRFSSRNSPFTIQRIPSH